MWKGSDETCQNSGSSQYTFTICLVPLSHQPNLSLGEDEDVPNDGSAGGTQRKWKTIKVMAMVLYCVLYLEGDYKNPEAYWHTFCHMSGMHLRMYPLLSTYTYGIKFEINSQNDAHRYVTAFYMFSASAWDSFFKAHSWLVWNDKMMIRPQTANLWLFCHCDIQHPWNGQATRTPICESMWMHFFGT